MHQLQIKTTRRGQLLDITDQIVSVVKEHGQQSKSVILYVPHTTAGILINESADPSVAADLLEYLEKLVPASNHYRHSEGNSDAHIKATLVGISQTIPIDAGKMSLGTWQGIFFAEFDGPRSRTLQITFLP